MAFAENTTVSIEKSKADIEKLLRKADATEFVSGWGKGIARIQCVLNEIYLQFVVSMPPRKEFEFTDRGRKRNNSDIDMAMEKEERRRWRGLLLVIKAKLEMIETGQSTIQEEFMSNILLPNGSTVSEWVIPQLAKVYEKETMPKLLPGS